METISSINSTMVNVTENIFQHSRLARTIKDTAAICGEKSLLKFLKQFSFPKSHKQKGQPQVCMDLVVFIRSLVNCTILKLSASFHQIHCHNTIFNKELVSRINIFFKTNMLIKTVHPDRKMGKKLNRYFTRGHLKTNKHIWKVLNLVNNQCNETKATLKCCYMPARKKWERHH